MTDPVASLEWAMNDRSEVLVATGGNLPVAWRLVSGGFVIDWGGRKLTTSVPAPILAELEGNPDRSILFVRLDGNGALLEEKRLTRT